MTQFSDHQMSFGERMTAVVDRGIHLAKRTALAFGLAVVGGIVIGAAVTDNALAQIVVSVMAAIGLWVPMLLALLGLERLLARRRRQLAMPNSLAHGPAAGDGVGAIWRRLVQAAPAERERINAIQRSLGNSHLALASAKLDPDAHDLCVLIDRRLPELIDRELDSLPPDDRGRRQRLDELIALVEQFARHCSRKREGQAVDASREAQILRRRFEDRLAAPPLSGQ
jgi:hypothetical protein